MTPRVVLGIALIAAAPLCAWFVARQHSPGWIAWGAAMLLTIAGIRLVTAVVRQSFK
jgi:hypothetical protein